MKNRAGLFTTIGVLIWGLMSGTAGAQGVRAPDRVFVLGLTGAGMIGEGHFSDMLGVGGVVGLEHRLSEGLSVSALTSLLRGVDRGDKVSICARAPAPFDGCLPSPLSPHWLSTLEANVIVTLFPGVPVSLIAGGGWSFASDARENWRGAPRTDSATKTQAVWRSGVDLRLGAGRAPRLQFTRSDFRPAPYGLSRVYTLTLLLRR